MGYYEVLRWLVNRRMSGSEEYYTPPEIKRGLASQGIIDDSVSGSCLRLEYDGLAEAKMNTDIRNWMRKYKATKRAIGVG